ncbi:hypothetical protein AB3N02_22165 [Priestia aryabhattai]|uniref:hypothetical protein n=1 Tax=Priestia aryabhattai TaxID=412384 RepID=UPI0039A06AD3
MTQKYYVTMTDKFMSGWGMAQGKINKLVLICDSYAEACTVYENAENRGDMKYINIRSTAPYYDKNRYYTQFKDKEEYGSWYKEGFFQAN